MIKACHNVAAPSPSCCSSLNTYIAGIQKQMLITNVQAIICATAFGSMLRKAGVMTNVYELCDIDLKDFSIQGLSSCYNSNYIIVFPIHFHPFCSLILSICLMDHSWMDLGQRMDNKVLSFPSFLFIF